jgi:16S rRNA (uracil1498-N3)-methyltransferase
MNPPTEPSSPELTSPPVRAHAFVEDLDAPELDAIDRHHFERVLRLRAGDALTVSDGRGGLRHCRFGPSLEPTAGVQRSPPPRPPVTVGFALTKGERPEWVVQKLTELGVDRVVPFVAARSVVRWNDEKAARNAERFGRIARGAAMQSRRTWLPLIEPVSSFAALASEPTTALAERGGHPPSLEHPTVLVGPEGGWDADELAAGLPCVGLGSGVLRADTAAIVAGALLGALRAGVTAPRASRPG